MKRYKYLVYCLDDTGWWEKEYIKIFPTYDKALIFANEKKNYGILCTIYKEINENEI